jgi:hypothetical protein
MQLVPGDFVRNLRLAFASTASFSLGTKLTVAYDLVEEVASQSWRADIDSRQKLDCWQFTKDILTLTRENLSCRFSQTVNTVL